MHFSVNCERRHTSFINKTETVCHHFVNTQIIVGSSSIFHCKSIFYLLWQKTYIFYWQNWNCLLSLC